MLQSINALDARPETTGTTDGRAEVAHLPGGAFLEGQWQRADLTLEVRDPEDGFLLGRVCSSMAADVRRAIAHIERHLQADEWPLRARREALERAVLLLGEQAERFANIIAAESRGSIAGAALDVVDPEPLPAGHPLWTMENVITSTRTRTLSKLSTKT